MKTQKSQHEILLANTFYVFGYYISIYYQKREKM